MIKRFIFRSLLFIIIFIGAALSFNYIQNRRSSLKAVEGFNPTMDKAYILFNGERINAIQGYKTTIRTDLYRDSIVPVDESKEIEILLTDEIDTGADLLYELRSFDGQNLIEEGDLRFVEKKDDYKDILGIENEENYTSMLNEAYEYKPEGDNFSLKIEEIEENNITFYLLNNYTEKLYSSVHVSDGCLNKTKEMFNISSLLIFIASIKKEGYEVDQVEYLFYNPIPKYINKTIDLFSICKNDKTQTLRALSTPEDLANNDNYSITIDEIIVNTKVNFSEKLNEQIKELKKVFNSSDNNFKEISRSEANKLIDNEIPEDVDFGCGPVYKFYAYDDYIFITNEDMCFHNTTVMIYTHNHKIDEINNVYQEVYSPEFGKESESLIDTHIVVKDGYLYFISGFHLDIPGPLVLCKYNLKHDQDYGEVVDIYDLEHLSQ